MIVLSWDVGVIHLAYCVLEYFDREEDYDINILDWDEINLLEGTTRTAKCCGLMKSGKRCGKKIFQIQYPPDGKEYGYCRTHLAYHNKIWASDQTRDLFKESSGKQCGHVNRNGVVCKHQSKYRFSKKHLCNVHYRQFLAKKIKEYGPQKAKKETVDKSATVKLQLLLVQKLDTLIDHFAQLGVQKVLIENQPHFNTLKMKSITNTLFDYFLIRGQIDKKINLNEVLFCSPSNKLKAKDNKLVVSKKNKYKLNKELSIKYTKELLSDQPLMLEVLDEFKKKDDVCDAYLQGRYYLEFRPKKEAKNQLRNELD